MLKIAAQKNGVWSDVTEVTIEFVQIPENDTGTKVYVGKAVCAGAEGQPDDVKVKVTTVNGEIALLEDNGTEPIGDIDNAFWWGNSVMETEGMPSKLQGKNLKELLNARTTPSDNEEVKVDAISGATLSSDSVKYATIAALRSQPIEEGQGEITPPVIQSEKIVAPNSSAGSISVIMTGESGAEIRYTLDSSEPTEESSLISEIPPFYDEKGVVLEADTDTYPNGRIVVVKAAAFLDGKRSDTVIARYVFANPNQKHSYESGTFQGSYSDIQAEVEIESPNFDQKYYITNISLDYDSQQKYKSFLPELLSNVYLNQDTEGVATINGFETESQAVLAAIQNAIQKAFVAAQPVISIEPNKTQYVNDEEVTVTLSCPTNDTQIYYVVDKSDGITSGELSDFEENKILYNGSFTVKIENTDGGTVYIRAAAQTTDGKLSTIARKDLDFIKAVNENAFTVNGKNYGIWADAVSALEQNGSGEIVLNDNIELLDSDKLPSVPCKIRSNEQQKYSIKGSILEANADITFDNVIYEINHIYANGHSVTIGEDVETSFSYWSYPSIYAGASYDAEETTIIGNPVITVNSGKFQLYGSGSGTTTVNGDVEIHIKGTAVAEVGGAYMNALVNGKVSVFVDDTATLEYFLGEQRGGSLTDIVLTIIGSPSLEGSTYRGSVNGTPKGTVDLSRATLTEEEIQKFEDFENIIKSETPENSEETSLIEDIKIDVSNEYELLDKTKESNIEESELEESEFISELSSNLKLQ